MVINKPVRAWIQTRISDDRTGEGLGVERHEYECRNLCDKRGWTVVGVTVENSISAARAGRKGLLDLLGRIERHEFDILVTWSADRLVRSLIDLERVIEACQRSGVRLATVSGDLDLSTDAGRLVARILASVARGELERKTARSRSRFEQTLRDGKPGAGGPRRFGYKRGNLEIDHTEAVLLRDAYGQWNSGATLGSIVRWLHQQGSVTPKGNTWTTASLRRVLANPANAGLRATLPFLVDKDGRPMLSKSGEPRRAEYHEVVGKAVWPCIVEEEEWQAAITRLKDPSRRTGRPNVGRKHLGSGLFRCGVCGLPMKGAHNNQRRAIRCPTLGHTTRKAQPIEDFVRDVILERLRQPDAAELVRRRQPGLDIPALRDEGDAIRGRLRALAQDEVMGRRTRDEVLAARDVASERLTEIDQALAAAGKTDVVAKFIGRGVDPLVVWNDPETLLSDRRGLVDALAVVRVGPCRTGRPQKYTENHPPPNVHVDWRRQG